MPLPICDVSYSNALYLILMHCVKFHFNVLYCIALYYILLHCIVGRKGLREWRSVSDDPEDGEIEEEGDQTTHHHQQLNGGGGGED